VARACADVGDEVPVQAPWTFGPIPPFEEEGIRAPSYQESVAIAVDWAAQWVLDNPDRPVVLGGYSQGGEAASRTRMEFEAGGRLEGLRRNFVAGYCFGNPSRAAQHTFHGGPPTPFDGIAAFRLPAAVCGDEWCELVDPGDLYGTSARGLTGEIERDVYGLCTELQIHDPQQFVADFIANCIEIVGNLDGDAGAALMAGADQQGVGLSGAHVFGRERIQPLADKVSLKGIACAVAAAIDGLIFFCSPPFPTAAHCEYHIREVLPGQTYVQLGVQHVRHWAAVVR
jgi:hypothetical protein